jgi:cytosine/adenosine deaminase-related metal-dependent hydrolase
MGGEIYLPGHEAAWALGRELGIPVAAHIVGTFGMRPTFDALAAAGAFGPDNLFIHMTGMSDFAWQKARDAGVAVSLAVPIEMNMRHGTPPIQKALDLGFQPSLSTDVECTLTADLFTQMRSAMALQRMFLNGLALGENGPPETHKALATTRDALRWATLNGARDLKLLHKTGSLTPGKEADIIILDAEAINVAPLNHVPGAVVSLMDRSNVETVLVAGKIRKWKGRMVDLNLRRLRRELEESRDGLFQRAGIAHDLFRAP